MGAQQENGGADAGEDAGEVEEEERQGRLGLVLLGEAACSR